MGDEESITSEDSEIEEELGYISPLDTVDPYLAFKQALTSEFSSSSKVKNNILKILIIQHSK